MSLQSINAIGRSDVVLRIEFVKKPVTLAIILIALQFDVMAVGISLPAASAFSMLVNMICNGRLLSYRFRDQLMDILPSFALSAVMAVCVYLMRMLPLPLLAVLILQVAAGCAMYVALSILTKNDSFHYLKNYLTDMLRRRGKRSADNGVERGV